MKEVVSTCIYCGCGCKLKYILNEETGKIERVLPVNEPVSEGKPCIKGLTIHEVLEGSIKDVFFRENKKKDFERVSFEYALEYLVDAFLKFEDCMFVASGEITNEDNYVLQKFARIVCQTNNIDSCARLCHAPTVLALKKILGITVVPNYMNDIYSLDTLLLVGTNPYSDYPTMFSRIVQAKERNNLKIIYLHHLDHKAARWADIKLIANVGSEIAILMFWIKYLLESGTIEKVEGLEALKQSVRGWDLDFVAELSGVDKELLKESAEVIADAKSFGVMHGMGITQQLEGTNNVMALLSLVLLKNGKFLSLRGKINIQGCGDMLCNPWLSLSQIKNLEKLWRVSLPKLRGKTLIEAFFIDPCEFMWISSMNPANSLPNVDLARKTLRKCFVVVSHYVWNETCNFANVVLPTPFLIEREGTITTGEGRVRYVRKIRKSKNMSEWQIFCKLASIINKDKFFRYRSPKDIFCEIVKIIPEYAHIDPEKVYREEDCFILKQPRYKVLQYINIKGAGPPLKEDEFLLTSQRRAFHFVTGDVTRLSETLRKACSEPTLLMNPEDAKRLKIKDGEMVIVYSKVAREKIKVEISEKVKPKTVAAPIHFEKFLFNRLVPLEFDHETHIPNYKFVIVRIKKIEKI